MSSAYPTARMAFQFLYRRLLAIQTFLSRLEFPEGEFAEARKIILDANDELLLRYEDLHDSLKRWERDCLREERSALDEQRRWQQRVEAELDTTAGFGQKGAQSAQNRLPEGP